MDPLIQKAIAAREHSYSPYSNFAVGAALETESGEVFTGTNVENAAYGLCFCAERTALVKAVSEGKRNFKRIAIVADLPETVKPCGMCRQMLIELAPSLECLCANLKGEVEQFSIKDLLPHSFSF